MRLGQHVTEEQKARMSIAQMGRVVSPEARAKISAARTGRKASPEARAKMSASRKGKPAWNKGMSPPDDVRTKISIAKKGHKASPETRAKMSASHLNPPQEVREKLSASRRGKPRSPETCAKIGATHRGPLSSQWKGGPRVWRAKGDAKRRVLGFVPVNRPFPGCDGHHINQNDVIYIPKAMHKSVPHNVWTGKNMDKINALVFAWYANNSD